MKKCPTCMRLSPPVREPMIPSPLPTYPWEKVATDLFEFQGQHYLLLVDYFSQYPEVIRLTSTTSASVISAMKSVFARHGIPSTIVSDNGPQYDSAELKTFASLYGFTHITSSPHYPQSNGQAERTVKTVKGLLQDSPDIFLSLLSYRATPLPWCGLSPGELLMGRRLRTDVPEIKRRLTPNWPHLQGFPEKDKEMKQRQKEMYDRQHRVRSVPTLPDDTPVWVNTQGRQVPGRVVTTANTPRSYVVEIPSGGRIRRNRTALSTRTETTTTSTIDPANNTACSRTTRSQAGIPI